MVAGHLREKNGIYQMVLELKDSNGKRKTKSISTGLPVKGNKRKAEQMLLEAQTEHSVIIPKTTDSSIDNDILFSDFIINWLSVVKGSYKGNTYCVYYYIIHNRIAPYFLKQGIYLKQLKPSHIQAYYAYLREVYHLKNKTIIRHHSNINQALEYAVNNDLISENPAKKVDHGKTERYIASVYDEDEIKQLFKAIKGDAIEFAVMMGVFYGLRREEILGLKWNAIDYANNTITIKHTITRYTLGGKTYIEGMDSTKTKASHRTLPMTESIKHLLMDKQNSQNVLMKVCGKSYNQEYKDYVNVDKQGNLLKPDYLSQHFGLLLKKYNLKHIRFHDLRHTCATLLYSKNIDMKKIQEWLGHNDISTTMNIYTLSLSHEERISRCY